jgi:hypothetical protein
MPILKKTNVPSPVKKGAPVPVKKKPLDQTKVTPKTGADDVPGLKVVEVRRKKITSIFNVGKRVAVVRTKSSAIPFVAYSLYEGILWLQFRSNESMWYGFENIPHSIWDKMAKAPSVGRFFLDKVRPKYRHSIVLRQTLNPGQVTV